MPSAPSQDWRFTTVRFLYNFLPRTVGLWKDLDAHGRRAVNEEYSQRIAFEAKGYYSENVACAVMNTLACNPGDAS
ncbi:hypothetical protein EVAR_18291_1 [Eumeta japonica]|uniref:Uncharacterized protein n=1 Tax=Eumeta variegata TaxID=151549 RepID=A0A4C1V954_EUMVA|nr:hypothetical protein EVAR_18291_1 [Eumeta japonica]